MLESKINAKKISHEDLFDIIQPGNRIFFSTGAGVVAEPLSAANDHGLLQLQGRFGVFVPGQCEAVLEASNGRVVSRQRLPERVTPLAAATIRAALKRPPSATTAVLLLLDGNGRMVGELARTPLRKP